MIQLLVTLSDDGDVSVVDIDATVPSGMPVLLSEMHTDRLYAPISIRLNPLYCGANMTDVMSTIEKVRRTVKDRPAPCKPWSR